MVVPDHGVVVLALVRSYRTREAGVVAVVGNCLRKVAPKTVVRPELDAVAQGIG